MLDTFGFCSNVINANGNDMKPVLYSIEILHKSNGKTKQKKNSPIYLQTLDRIFIYLGIVYIETFNIHSPYTLQKNLSI